MYPEFITSDQVRAWMSPESISSIGSSQSTFETWHQQHSVREAELARRRGEGSSGFGGHGFGGGSSCGGGGNGGSW